MTDFSDFAEAARAVVDPTTSPTDLAAIAEAQPGLWAQVASHPAAYPELLAWLDSVGDTTVKAAIAAHHPSAYQTQQFAPAPAPQPMPQPMQQQPYQQAYQQPMQQPYQPPMQQRTQGWQPAPQKQSFLASTKGRVILISAAIVVVLVVVIALVINYAVLVPQRNIEVDFNDSVAAYQQVQTDLNTQLDAAKTTASSFTDDTLTDATTLSSLNDKIQQASAAVAQPVPAMASSTSDIQQQVTTLDNQSQSMHQLIDDLAAGITSVQSSGLLWAKSTLTTAIGSANSTYTQYSYTTDTGALDALQSQIASAGQVLDTIDQVDPNMVVTVTNDAISALTDAQAAVVASAPTHCGDVTLPDGIDPMVCSGMPNTAISLPGVPDWGGMFQMPSANIGCYPTGNGVMCEIASHSWKMPSALMQACQNSDAGQQVACDGSIIMLDDGVVGVYAHGDVPQWQAAKMEGAKIPTLTYGNVIDYTPAACLSASSGLTCWDVDTHHGFKVSQSKIQYW